MNRQRLIRLLAVCLSLSTAAYGQVIAKGVSISGGLSCGQTTAPIFSPPPGTYSSPQNVTITCPKAGQTATVRSDGGFVSAASPLYSGPMTTSSTTTYQAECVTFGGTSLNPTYQTNTQASNTGFVCHTYSGGTFTGPPSITCTSSGGVGTVNPTNLVASFPGGSSPATFTITTPANTSGSETQALFVYQFGGSVDPSASTCDTCTSQVKDVKFTVIGSGMANQENDLPQYDPTHGNTDRQNGTQCQGYGTGAVIAVDSGNAGGWTTTPISCSNWTAGTTHEIVNRVDHDLTGTCPGGNGCALYRYYDIDGVYNAMNGNYGNTQGYHNNSGSAWGWQFQPDMKATTGTAATGGWSVISATVALTMGDDSPLTTATYNIVAPSTATPILEPNNYVTGNYALAQPSPILAFGNQATSTSSPAIPISISNPSNANYCTYFGIGCGSGTVTVTSMTVTGTNASDFTLAGSCTTIASGSDCEPTITFTPTATANTNETATLTVNYSGATTSSQTMSLTGKSVTSTTLSSTSNPTALSGSTNYQVGTAITAAGTNFTIASAGTDLNLDGFTITYGNTSTASQVNQIAAANYNTGITLHNGTFAYGAGTNTKGAGHPQSSGFSYTGSFNMASGITVFNTLFNYNIEFANAVEDNNGFLVFHDNKVLDSAVGTCASIACRNQLFATPVYQENVSTRPSGSSQFYNNFLSGGPQGGLDGAAPGTIISYNTIQPGNVSGNNTNDFAIYAWGQADQVYDNSICTPLAANCNTRGIQISAAQSPGETGVDVYNNIIGAYETPTNAEYGGCQVGGAYGLQFDDNPVGPNTAYNNYSVAYAKACSGAALRITDSRYLTNLSHNNTFIATRLSGATACVRYPDNAPQPGCANASEWDGPTGFTSQNDSYTGDSCDILLDISGGSGVVIQSPTFNEGSNPSNFHTFCAENGTPSQGGGPVTNFHVIDASFNTGTSATDTDFPQYNVGNQGDVSLYIDWTQTVTVNMASGPAVSGAVVTWTGTLGTPVSCTTNSSGVCSIAVTQYRNNNDTAANTHESWNPYTISIPATGGCSAYSQAGVTISATASTNITLTGC